MKINSKTSIVLAALLLSAAFGRAQTATNTFHFGNLSLPIPDNNLSGASNTQTISLPNDPIERVSITFTISGTGSGAFNGDYYGYLSMGEDLVVLLNRPGRTASNPVGYGDNGFQNVRFDDDAANGDVHVYRETVSGNPSIPLMPVPSPLTGTWSPDGRTNAPTLTLDTDLRATSLSVFNGNNASGAWTIFFADLESGGTGMLDSWTLEIVTVPEPATTLLLGVAAISLFFLRRRRSQAKRSAG